MKTGLVRIEKLREELKEQNQALLKTRQTEESAPVVNSKKPIESPLVSVDTFLARLEQPKKVLASAAAVTPQSSELTHWDSLSASEQQAVLQKQQERTQIAATRASAEGSTEAFVLSNSAVNSASNSSNALLDWSELDNTVQQQVKKNLGASNNAQTVLLLDAQGGLEMRNLSGRKNELVQWDQLDAKQQQEVLSSTARRREQQQQMPRESPVASKPQYSLSFVSAPTQTPQKPLKTTPPTQLVHWDKLSLNEQRQVLLMTERRRAQQQSLSDARIDRPAVLEKFKAEMTALVDKRFAAPTTTNQPALLRDLGQWKQQQQQKPQMSLKELCDFNAQTQQEQQSIKAAIQQHQKTKKTIGTGSSSVINMANYSQQEQQAMIEKMLAQSSLRKAVATPSTPLDNYLEKQIQMEKKLATTTTTTATQPRKYGTLVPKKDVLQKQKPVSATALVIHENRNSDVMKIRHTALNARRLLPDDQIRSLYYGANLATPVAALTPSHSGNKCLSDGMMGPKGDQPCPWFYIKQHYMSFYQILRRHTGLKDLVFELHKTEHNRVLLLVPNSKVLARFNAQQQEGATEATESQRALLFVGQYVLVLQKRQQQVPADGQTYSACTALRGLSLEVMARDSKRLRVNDTEFVLDETSPWQNIFLMQQQMTEKQLMAQSELRVEPQLIETPAENASELALVKVEEQMRCHVSLRMRPVVSASTLQSAAMRTIVPKLMKENYSASEDMINFAVHPFKLLAPQQPTQQLLLKTFDITSLSRDNPVGRLSPVQCRTLSCEAVHQYYLMDDTELSEYVLQDTEPLRKGQLVEFPTVLAVPTAQGGYLLTLFVLDDSKASASSGVYVSEETGVALRFQQNVLRSVLVNHNQLASLVSSESLTNMDGLSLSLDLSQTTLDVDAHSSEILQQSMTGLWDRIKNAARLAVADKPLVMQKSDKTADTTSFVQLGSPHMQQKQVAMGSSAFEMATNQRELTFQRKVLRYNDDYLVQYKLAMGHAEAGEDVTINFADLVDPQTNTSRELALTLDKWPVSLDERNEEPQLYAFKLATTKGIAGNRFYSAQSADRKLSFYFELDEGKLQRVTIGFTAHAQGYKLSALQQQQQQTQSFQDSLVNLLYEETQELLDVAIPPTYTERRIGHIVRNVRQKILDTGGDAQTLDPEFFAALASQTPALMVSQQQQYDTSPETRQRIIDRCYITPRAEWCDRYASVLTLGSSRSQQKSAAAVYEALCARAQNEKKFVQRLDHILTQFCLHLVEK
jgi:predicted Fe-S protein YdhL (DUF1289 family)